MFVKPYLTWLSGLNDPYLQSRKIVEGADDVLVKSVDELRFPVESKFWLMDGYSQKHVLPLLNSMGETPAWPKEKGSRYISVLAEHPESKIRASAAWLKKQFTG